MRTTQRGQALPLGLALILVGVLGGLVLYNVGQSATDKARLVNAADAAAYSGVLWQARALNFQAYTNRAMVANQVSMAQAVSLRSWVTYGRVTADNLSTVLGPIPIIGQIATGISTAIDGVERVASPVANAMLGIVDKVNVGIGAAQEGMFRSSFAATPEIVRAVVAASDERFTADTAYSMLGALGNLESWQSFTRRVSTDDAGDIERRRQMIMRSRDGFSDTRNWSLFDGYLYIVPFQWRLDIERRGDTRLVASADGTRHEWKAKDAVSIENSVNSWIRGWKRSEVPIGWAQAYASSPAPAGAGGAGRRAGPGVAAAGVGAGSATVEPGACTRHRDYVGFRRRDCNRWLGRRVRTAEAFSDVGAPSLKGTRSRVGMSGYSGINPFRDLAEDTIEKDFPTLRLKIEVALPLEATESTDNEIVAEPFATGMSAPGNLLSSVSVSEVFFKPPHADHDGADGAALEFANAYSPYWDVRLAPVSEAERMAAFALRDHSGTAVPGGTRVPDGAAGLGAWGGDASGARSAGELAGPGLGPWAGLAGELGADAGVAAGLVADASALGAPDLVAGLEARFGRVDADAIGEAIRTEVGEALEGALADMMAGIAGGAGDIRSGADLRAWADERTGGLISDAEGLRADAEAELATLRGLQPEFERIAEAITDDVVALVQERVAAPGAEVEALLATLDAVEGAVDEAGEPIPVPGAAEVEAARERLAEIEVELVDELAAELVDRVDEVADAYRMPMGVARETIRTLLRDLRREPAADGAEDEIDWDPFGLGESVAAGEDP